MISYWLLSYSQAGLIPPPNVDDRRAFTPSERILMDFQKLKRMNAQDIKDLIQDVLHIDNFDSDEVDHNMHDRLTYCILFDARKLSSLVSKLLKQNFWIPMEASRTAAKGRYPFVSYAISYNIYAVMSWTFICNYISHDIIECNVDVIYDICS